MLSTDYYENKSKCLKSCDYENAEIKQVLLGLVTVLAAGGVEE